MTTAQPELTAVLMVDRQRERGVAALQSILTQSHIEKFEVLLLDFAIGKAPPLAGSDHPAVRSIPVPAAYGFGQSRALAVHLARAPIVAFVEEHVRVLPGWAEALLRRHQTAYAAVGPRILLANPGRSWTELSHTLRYYAWSTSGSGGPVDHLVISNSSFKTAILRQYGRRLSHLLTIDLLLCRQLNADGYAVYYEPEACIEHALETRLREQLRITFVWDWLFNAERCQLEGWAPPQRGIRLVLTPLWPIFHLLRQFSLVLTRRPAQLTSFVWHAPRLLLLNFVGGLGRIRALTRGAGDADQMFRWAEMNEYRGIPGVREIRA